MSHYNSAGVHAQYVSGGGTVRVVEAVYDCKLRCDMDDRCISFMWNHITKECWLSNYRYPSLPHSLDGVQSFCSRDLDGYFSLFIFSCFAFVKKFNVKKQL